MLGVFRANLCKLPLPPEIPADDYDCTMKASSLLSFLIKKFDHTVSIFFGTYGYLAYSADLNISPAPGYTSHLLEIYHYARLIIEITPSVPFHRKMSVLFERF